ncbi:MAG: hypothetical protein HY706_08485 [Candidatus Hydrogenedentes bacterium]|nr:hypothetical protein [Candidatus Hydrogenedentota bacterium]
MRKLILTCDCGQRMQVPRSALGKAGLCPNCGRSVPIMANNTTPAPLPKQARPLSGKALTWQGAAEPAEDAKRKFGEAVDLYYSQRYAEALAIFDSLTKVYPGNPDIENGRSQCINALKRPLALEKKETSLEGAKLDAQTVRKVVLEKMLAGNSEAVQLQAAELASKILGLCANGKAPEASPPEESPVAPEDDAGKSAAFAPDVEDLGEESPR